MMITDWKKEIALAWYVQNETAKLDTNGLWGYFLPKVAATEEELLATENVLGCSLDCRYREFLHYTNGWRGFLQRVDLFGTEELCDSSLMRQVYLLLNETNIESLEPDNTRYADLLPIGFSREQGDVFALVKPTAAKAGMVIWLAGYEIQRFPTFDEFFLAMVDYNRLRLERFRSGAHAS